MSLPNPTFAGQEATVAGKTYEAVSVSPPVWAAKTTGTHGRRIQSLEEGQIRNVTSAKAASEDAVIGTRYRLTDFNGAPCEVVAAEDTGGFYPVTLPSGRKLKLEIKRTMFISYFGLGAVGLVNYNLVKQALAVLPVGSELVIDNLYAMNHSIADTPMIELTKNINLVGLSTRLSGFRFDNVPLTSHGLLIRMEDNDGFTDVRNWKMTDLTLFFNGGGADCIRVDGTGFALNTCAIENCNLARGAATGAYAFRADYPAASIWAHSEFRRNTVTGTVGGNIADANLFTKNLHYGNDCAYEIDTELGVYNNSIRDNTLVCRDGALRLINGSMIQFTGNQIEQFQVYGRNQSTPCASVYIKGQDRACLGVTIESNNFGGGTNVDYSVYVDNAQYCTINKGQMVAVNLNDVYFTANAKFNKVGRDINVLTQVSNPRTDKLFKLKIIDATNGSNINTPFLLGGQNGWNTVRCTRDELGMLHVLEPLEGGVTATGTIIGYLEPDNWPLFDLKIPVVDSTGAIGYLECPSTNGQLKVGSLSSNAGVSLLRPIQAKAFPDTTPIT